ncbi:MAG: valine--tRNA ligase [Chitinispirillaceae bacterium]|nr:valine--tRNA ligase [Chitinispirillaceae bacterium]
MEKIYDPSRVEEKWYAFWLRKKLFHADPASKKPAYSIVIPPPNVTGVLHMGHALNNTIQDILIRYKKMAGYETLWMPGTDHAGIATQNVVERKLAKEQKSRHDLGRDAFINEVWNWKAVHHATITSQLKQLGCACDWNRERFTMDEGLSKVVRKVFVDLYNSGLIYKGKYIINWCPRCHTALSDEEAEHRETKGELYHFKYPYADGPGFVTVATTRPETMLGDTAVAVNPKDGRYTDCIGKMLLLPLVERPIPVIADDFVDREFGTGAVKVTPAHDPNDFQMGLRHGMDPIVVMDEAGCMAGPVPKRYLGVDRFSARQMVVEELTVLGLVEKIEEHTHAVGHCYRCSTVVEPYYSDQWFVKMKPLAADALSAAREDRITIIPQRWRRTYHEWMENIRDWCISRQIWWGHRIPVWYCSCGTTIVAENAPRACPQCGSTDLSQDTDVLDTWFSSWLWPFSTMGWPEDTAEMAKFYPTNVLATAPEILFFWVARMIMAGLYFTGKVPFADVVLHGTVRDKSGRKMSKSLGNAIDPLKIIKASGADALRFSLIMITAQGADVFLGNDTFDIGRNFANKLWNAARFLLFIDAPVISDGFPPKERRKAEDRWILNKLQLTIEGVTRSIDNYRFNEACHLLYDFTWHEFCDWYIEAKKADLYQTERPQLRSDALALSGYLLETLLKLLHPFMPFITEEIYWHLRDCAWSPDRPPSESIMTSAGSFVTSAASKGTAAWPEKDDALTDPVIEPRFSLVKEIIIALRTIKSENNIPPDKWGNAVIITVDPDTTSWLQSQSALINRFAKLTGTTIAPDARKPEFAGSAVVDGNQLYISFEGLIDREVELERLTKESARIRKLIDGTKNRLDNGSFVDRAPPAVVAKEREKLEGLVRNLEKVEHNLSVLVERRKKISCR